MNQSLEAYRSIFYRTSDINNLQPRKKVYYYLVLITFGGHLFHLAVFSFLRLYPLIVWNVFGSLLFAGLLLLIKMNKHELAFMMAQIELTIYVFVNYCFVGWNFGYQYSIFALLSVAYLDPFGNTKKSMLTAAFQALVFVGLSIHRVFDARTFAIVEAYPTVFLISTTIHLILFTFGVIVCMDMTNIEKALYDYRLRKENQRLELKTQYDKLTGLLFRKEFRKKLELLHNQVQKFGGSYVVMFADIDDFKKVNDHYGHMVGDQVLKEVTNCFRQHI